MEETEGGEFEGNGGCWIWRNGWGSEGAIEFNLKGAERFNLEGARGSNLEGAEGGRGGVNLKRTEGTNLEEAEGLKVIESLAKILIWHKSLEPIRYFKLRLCNLKYFIV